MPNAHSRHPRSLMQFLSAAVVQIAALTMFDSRGISLSGTLPALSVTAHGLGTFQLACAEALSRTLIAICLSPGCRGVLPPMINPRTTNGDVRRRCLEPDQRATCLPAAARRRFGSLHILTQAQKSASGLLNAPDRAQFFDQTGTTDRSGGETHHSNNDLGREAVAFSEVDYAKFANLA